MKKFKKLTAYIAIILVLIIVSAVSYITLALPNVGKPEDIKIALTPQRVQRGKYLANHVAVCMDCHSHRRQEIFAAPIDTNILGAGGDVFDARAGFPGEVHVPNITPHNLKTWTDGEIFRAITTGVKKDGSAIFPLMPWPYYAKMDREDVYSIIAYLRTLKERSGDYPKSKLDFPLNILVHTMPKKAELSKKPAESDTLKYGAYMVQTAACMDCHTQSVQGKMVAGMEFAGGRVFTMPGGILRTANITPDNKTGIGSWTKEQFVNRFSQYADSTNKQAVVKPGDFQTIMPWYKYGGMKPADLAAVYTYLRTVKPVSNKVIKFQVNNQGKSL